MSEFESKKLKILLISDIDITSASLLSEKYIPNSPEFDLVIACGPFTHDIANSPEEIAIAEGDMASTISQLENIVCHVVYLPSEVDPPSSLSMQLHLTPNSVNTHARYMSLKEDLYVIGFTEKSEALKTAKLPNDIDRSPESDDELDNVEVISSTTSIDIINEICTNSNFGEENNDNKVNNISKKTGIFILNYKYSHTLNHVLFHIPEVLNDSNINICVIPSNTEESKRLPSKLGKLNLIVLKSLKNGGNYTILNLVNKNLSWNVLNIENCVI
jgi:hypothetical protein